MTKVVSRIQDFLRLESAAGLILMAAALFAIAANNTILSHWYGALLSTPVVVQLGALEIAKPLLLWINDGLMAVFFFLVGLEIKREVLEGELSSFDKAVLPMLAAIGGMAGPAFIYVALNWADPDTLRGWAIPAATDIAFALGILALLGTRVPVALKIFLLAIAIIDDLGAILIIALFYTDQLSLNALGLAGAGFAALILMNRLGVKRIAPFVLVGVFMWVCVLKSGVHATLAGVLTALAIPLAARAETGQSPLHKLEHGLHPWVAFLILPVFAFANAGVDLRGVSLEALAGPVPLGIALGLFVGKQLGVFGLTYGAVRLGLARLPSGVSWLQIYGVACLTGVGFTMSLFIGGLAFDSAAQLDQVRLGVLMGSVASGILGYAMLRLACRAEGKSATKRPMPNPV
ncbi:MAG: Na+/H+ antiporter NhaA [Alphaproteobacteria bacterium]|nr:Na+/H+ antiporter NhaA [Alphaproteobacteria bacterium]MBU2083483.1 Na+/H+ antiporter NhaA [Alphaproteobacteria bacterium]MBU2143551.1 Na+/H+ antiporter NhaA [Alphaproteobacteria bacterium]MBU2196048.1 Na+/H+ antiporter NhaA [Alphaproteobacteria bacterium]